MTEPLNATEVDTTVRDWQRLEERAKHVAKLVAYVRWHARYQPYFSLFDVDLQNQTVELEYDDHGDTMSLSYPVAYLSLTDDQVVEAEERAEELRRQAERTRLEREAQETEQRRAEQERSTWERLNRKAKAEGWA